MPCGQTVCHICVLEVQTNNNQIPVTKPIYSFQSNHASNLPHNMNNQFYDGNQSNKSQGPSYFLKSPGTTKYSTTQKSSSNQGTNLNEHLDQSEKLTASDQNNISVNQDEQHKERGNGRSYSQSILNQSPTLNNRSSPSKQIMSQRQASKIEKQLTQSSKFYCKIHAERFIEYYCQQCHQSVCSRCMFENHNGHELSQIDDALKLMRSKLLSFDEKLVEVIKENEESKNILVDYHKQVEQMREKQQKLIDQKFKDLIQKIEERKQQISREVLHKYESAVFKVADKLKMIVEQFHELKVAKEFYEEIFNKLQDDNFIKNDCSPDQVEFLNRAPEYDRFIYENTLKLKSILIASKNAKIEYQEGTSIGLRPIELNLQNANNLIQALAFDSSKIGDYSLSQNLQQLKQLPPKDIVPKDSYAASNEDTQIQNFATTNLLINKNIVKDSQFGSKFAKLKFQRHGTETSQELQLNYENLPTQENQNNINIISSRQQKENELKQIDKETVEEIQSQKIKLLDNAIYCIGDTRYILMFDYKNSIWQQIYYDREGSDYQGTLKFTSICQLNSKKREFIMTGGCNKATKEASSQCYRFSIPNMRTFREVQRLKQARYGHASVFINHLVLVLGGFNHRDDEAQAPNTLNTCEKYSIKENEWSPIAPMSQERAYFSAVRVKEEFIYVFGGFQNYETTNTIEFYNIMLDKWTSLTITMPIKLAKYGLAKIEENQIVIAGGLLVDNQSTRSSGENTNYSCVNTAYKFDCNTLKWTKLSKLNFRRSMYSNMAVKENLQIFAIGGTIDGINEVYDIRKKKWNTCQSYTSIVGQNDLQTYAICSLCKFGED
ncbi:kelch motif family protein [Stylonychia lemnae]|uniref:Kelch motif family protein n=1 Tax=Stylonychia lemnae TaxID=5949 RepID=A0A077ZSQ9_STYLE|nr:kelch motif family protein [Stylonychia lemnae]|eukprot:CDW72594.1 kelch motif family protein [Stylonychia lemnae]